MSTQNNTLQNYLDNNEIYKNKKNLLKSNYDQNNASLLQNYNAQSQSLAQSKKDSQQAAAIAHQKLLKYLPEYNASMGLYGNGASESALLDANARYRSTQGQIAASYNTQKAQLDADHSARQASLLQNYNQDQMDLYSEAAAAHKSDQENTYNMAMNTINSWTGTADDLHTYMYGEDGKGGLKSKLTDDQFKSLEQAYNTALEVVSEDENNQKEIEEYQPQDISSAGDISVTAPTGYSRGKNFTVTVGNETYNVQVGAEISSGAAKNAAINGNVGDGEIFVYGNEVYIKNGDSVYRVEDRFWDAGGTHGLKLALDFKKG